jgi:hypothetical protein
MIVAVDLMLLNETVDALAEQHTLSLGVGDGHIVELEVNVTNDMNIEYYGNLPAGGGQLTIHNPDGLMQGLENLYVRHLRGGPLCVQTTEDAGNLGNWSGYYESHSTDQSGCTNWNNHRFGVALSQVDNWNPTTFRCRDGSVAPGTCRGIKLRVHCFSACEFEVILDYTTPPVVVSSVVPVNLDALAEHYLLSLEAASVHNVDSHFGDSPIQQQSIQQFDIPPGHYLTVFNQAGIINHVDNLKVTLLGGGPICVQTTEDAGDNRDWSGYYESHSTDQSGCTNENNHRFGVALDNWDRTTFRCRDGSAAPGTCRGIKFRVHCSDAYDSSCYFEVNMIWQASPIVSSFLPYEPYYDEEGDAAELSTAALSGIVVGCVAGVGLIAGGAYAMKKKQSSDGMREPLV